MSTLISLYVRVPTASNCEAFLQKSAQHFAREAGELALHPNARWLELRWRGFPKAAAEVAKQASSQLDTEVLFAIIQTAASVFEVGRYERGRERRYVVSADGIAWTARGEPEVWERRIFTANGQTDEELDQVLTQNDESAHPALIQLFKDGFIVDGKTDPLASSSGSYCAVATALGMGMKEFGEFAQNEVELALRRPRPIGRLVFAACVVAILIAGTLHAMR